MGARPSGAPGGNPKPGSVVKTPAVMMPTPKAPMNNGPARTATQRASHPNRTCNGKQTSKYEGRDLDPAHISQSQHAERMTRKGEARACEKLDSRLNEEQRTSDHPGREQPFGNLCVVFCNWPGSAILTKRYLDFAHFYGRSLFDLFQYTARRAVSFVREKEVSSLVITFSCDPVSSLPICFYQTDLAKGRVTCRGNTPDAWAQDRHSSVASGRTARGKAFQSVSSRPQSCSLVSSSDQSLPLAAARSDLCPQRGNS